MTRSIQLREKFMPHCHRLFGIGLTFALVACSSSHDEPKPPFLRVNPDGTCDITTHKSNGSDDVVQLHEPTCKVTSLGLTVDVQASGDGMCGPITCTRYSCDSTSKFNAGNCPVPQYEWGQTWTIVEH
jgi:hypothetical protein